MSAARQASSIFCPGRRVEHASLEVEKECSMFSVGLGEQGEAASIPPRLPTMLDLLGSPPAALPFELAWPSAVGGSKSGGTQSDALRSSPVVPGAEQFRWQPFFGVPNVATGGRDVEAGMRDGAGGSYARESASSPSQLRLKFGSPASMSGARGIGVISGSPVNSLKCSQKNQFGVNDKTVLVGTSAIWKDRVAQMDDTVSQGSQLSAGRLQWPRSVNVPIKFGSVQKKVSFEEPEAIVPRVKKTRKCVKRPGVSKPMYTFDLNLDADEVSGNEAKCSIGGVGINQCNDGPLDLMQFVDPSLTEDSSLFRYPNY
ncbi:hypothetical protein EJB05_15132 [Eragrostis curvula]|uniref:Uncharacterized protein n=1 Tax=Eragrostis curvula TaxID=38414 RepID=A0A5J9W2P9_9POAL|nr:hypothetical protein EJB05_15132 [Eragrostis curvula]